MYQNGSFPCQNFCMPMIKMASVLMKRFSQMSSYASFVFGISLFLILVYLIQSLISGKKAPANPWGGVSMEWETATPPIEHNFEGMPICKNGPYDFPEIEVDPNAKAH